MNKQDLEKHYRACAKWLDTRPEADKKIRLLLSDRSTYSNEVADELSRPVVVTAFGGHYERPAGYTIALNGSPVRAVIVSLAHGPAFMRRMASVRALRPGEVATVTAYLKSLQMADPLTSQPYPFTMYVDGELVSEAVFNIQPWFWRNQELYRELGGGDDD